MAEWKRRIGLAWAALRGQLRGGLYITPIDLTKARFELESCSIVCRVGKDVPLLQFSQSWKDVVQITDQLAINRNIFHGNVR